MSQKKTILIVDDDLTLRNQLVRLTQEVIPNWQIIQADNYNDAINKVNQYKINVLVSDLYLKPDEDRNQNKSIPSGIKVADYLRKKQPDSNIYIVSSNINTLISQAQLSEYISIGVTQFLDRNVTPYEKFSQLFQYQLQLIDKSISNSKYSEHKIPKIFGDNKGNLVIKTKHEAFVAIPLDEGKKISTLSAKKSIAERTAIFMAQDSHRIASQSEKRFSSATKFTSIDPLFGISKPNTQNFKVISRLSPNDFFIELSKELYRNIYTYMRLESENIQGKKELVVYAVMLMKLIPGYEDVYSLSIPKKTTKKVGKIFNDIVNNFKESLDWSIYPMSSGILNYDKPYSYLLIPKGRDRDADEILASTSLISTLK